MKASWWLVLGVVALVAAAVLLVQYRAPDLRTRNPGATASTAATFYCANGAEIQAVFGADSVSLTLPGGRNLKLPQALSASGARYQSTTTDAVHTDIVFWNKGDTAFLTENDKTTYADCTAAIINESDAPGYNTYTDRAGTFTFAFPTDFSAAGSAPGYTPEWSAFATTSGLVLARIEVPRSYEPGTNFGEAWFTVGTSEDPASVAQCLGVPSGIATTSVPAAFGGVSYQQFSYVGAGAGNYYDTTTYRTVRNQQCYAIEYTIHSSNIYNYTPGTVKAYDDARVRRALEEVARSFRFLR